jgi:hypothetical protein
MLSALSVGTSAWAADCATPYTIDGLLADLTGVEAALRTQSDSDASAAGLRLRDGLGCLDEILPAPIAARSYRAVGAGLYSKGDPGGAERWFRTALELEPTWEYGVQDVPEGHPLRNDFDALKVQMGSEPVALEGKTFGPGTHYLDGRKITAPRARMERFHVYQVDGSGVVSAVIDGNAFPAANLVAAAASEAPDTKAPKAEKTKSNKTPTEKDLAKAELERQKQAEKVAAQAKAKTRVSPDGTVYYDRVRPKEKTPLLIAGGVVMASAGLVYYGADRTSARMEGIRTIFDVNPDLSPGSPFTPCTAQQDPKTDGCAVTPNAELDRLAGVANRLVVASIAVFAVGVGTTTWGVLVDGGTAMPTVNIRF